MKCTGRRFETKPVFRDAFKRTRCLPDVRILRMVEHPEWEAALVFHRRRWLAASYRSWSSG